MNNQTFDLQILNIFTWIVSIFIFLGILPICGNLFLLANKNYKIDFPKEKLEAIFNLSFKIILIMWMLFIGSSMLILKIFKLI